MVLLHYEHICVVCLSEHEATRKYQKNLPKTLPKRSPNDEKIDVKNVLFFDIDFLGFRPRFWSLLGLQLGAKLGHIGLKTLTMVVILSLLKLDVLKNCVLDGPWLDFEGSRPRFQRVLGPIFRKCSTFSGLLW